MVEYKAMKIRDEKRRLARQAAAQSLHEDPTSDDAVQQQDSITRTLKVD